jgi:hypothetical protein
MKSQLEFFLRRERQWVLLGQKGGLLASQPITKELLYALSTENKTPKFRQHKDPSSFRYNNEKYRNAIYDSLAKQGLGVEDFKVFITHESETFEIIVLETQDKRRGQLGWIDKGGNTVFLSEHYGPDSQDVKTVSCEEMLSHFNLAFARIAANPLNCNPSVYPTEESVIIDYRAQRIDLTFKLNTVGHFDFVFDRTHMGIRIKLTPTVEYEKYESILVVSLCPSDTTSRISQRLKDPFKKMMPIEQWEEEMEYRAKVGRYLPKSE